MIRSLFLHPIITLRMMIAATCIGALMFFAACSSTQLQNVQTLAQKLQSDISAACNVLQPAIAPFAPFFVGNAIVTAFNADVALACSGNALLNLTSIQNVINSSATAASQVVTQIPNLNATQVAMIQSLIGAFKGSLTNALAAYQQGQAAAGVTSTSGAVTAAPASTPAPASAPAAASAAVITS